MLKRVIRAGTSVAENHAKYSETDSTERLVWLRIVLLHMHFQFMKSKRNCCLQNASM